MTRDNTTRHRPLAAGIAIWPSAGEDHRGTLTAVARRRTDNARVLVTCVHVVSANHADGSYGITGDEYIYQGGTNAFDKVGQLYTLDTRKSWTPVRRPGMNTGDFAALRVEHDVTTDLGIHTHPGTSPDGAHRYVPIVAGAKSPESDPPLSLTMVGGVSGIGDVTVLSTGSIIPNVKPTEDESYRFGGVTVLDISRHDGNPGRGDSGSPLLWRDPDGNYRMCAMYIGSDPRPRTDNPENKVGLAYPAYAIESILGIKFGVEAPTARIANPDPVSAGQWFLLDGSGSEVNESGAEPLKYEWEKVEATALPTPFNPLFHQLDLRAAPIATSKLRNWQAPTFTSSQ